MNLSCALFGLLCALQGPAKAIDGDTLKVDGQRVRLAGIDAEEMHEAYGPTARGALAAMIAGEQVHCEDTGQRSYNRIVAICYIGEWRPEVNLSLNARMVREGHALDCASYSKGQYRKMELEGSRSWLKQKPYC